MAGSNPNTGVPYKYATMTSTPAWDTVEQGESTWGDYFSVGDRLIPFSSPITFTIDYDVTTPLKGAVGSDWLNTEIWAVNYITPRFIVNVRVGGNLNLPLGWETERSFGFDGTHAEITFTPKDFFDEFLEFLKNHSQLVYRDAYDDLMESPTKYAQTVKSLNIRMYGVALCGSTFMDGLTLSGYDVTPMCGLTAITDCCMPPEGMQWADTRTNLDETGSQKITVYRMITLSTTLPPTEVTLSQSSAAPGQTVWLSWSGAQPGESNDIIGYEVYRATSADGDYTLLTTVSSTETSGSVAVTAPAAKGAAYYYKVVTLGSVDGYSSAKSAVYATLVCNYSVCLAPTKVTIDGATNVEPGAPVTVKWEGASAGENNAINGYQIGCFEPTSGDAVGLQIGIATLWGSTLDGFGSVDDFTAPTENGVTYRYRVKTCGQLDGTDSDWSEAYAEVTCTYSSTNAPTNVTVDGAKSVYVAPGATVLLEWSGASDGANNTITGYDILRDGEVYFADLPSTAYREEVLAHDTTGNAYKYSVVAKGQYANSAPSAAATVYSYTDPTAPTTVDVSTPDSYVGGRVELSWSGAAPGGFNDIVGYKVYASDTVNGTQTLVATIASTETSASCYVDAPSTSGGTAYFRVVTVGSYSDSASSDYVTVTASGDAGADSEVTVIIKPEAPRPKRGMVLGDYDTAQNGWTLTGWSFEEPEPQTSYVEIPWRADGPLDASTVLTGGDPRYGSRTLAATFECSEGTREDREQIISRMVNWLHGRRKNITLPDDRSRYIVGRIRVRKIYSDLAHASVEITAVCEPWRYSKTETRLELLVTENARTEAVCNNGRKVLVPELTVTGYKANVHISTGDLAWTLTAGTYRLPDLRLPSGATLLTYSGSGQVTIKYQEAIL